MKKYGIVFLLFGVVQTFSYGEEISIPKVSYQRAVMFFNIPSQALSTSLIEFASQAQTLVIVDYNLVKSYKAESIRGKYRIEDALLKLLHSTNLTFTYDSSNSALTIKPKVKLSSHVDEDGAESPLYMEEVYVTGPRYPFRYNTITNSHIHSNLTEFESVRFFSSFNRNLIEDQEPIDLVDLLRNSSSITPADGLADTNDDFYIRGYRRNAIYLNGFRLASDIGTKLSPSLIERVEVVKGPSTLRFGQSEPGGVVNVLPRNPTTNNEKSIEIKGGTDSYYQINGAFGADVKAGLEKFSAGIVADYYRQHELRNSKHLVRTAIAPSIRFLPSRNSALEVFYSHQNTSLSLSQGNILLIPGTSSFDLLSFEVEEERNSPNFESELSLGYLKFYSQLSQDWNFTAGFLYQTANSTGVRGSQDVISDTPTLIDKDDIKASQIFFTVFDRPIPLDINSIISDASTQVYSANKLTSLFDETTESKNAQFIAKLEGVFDSFLGSHNITMGVDFYDQQQNAGVGFEERNDIKFINLLSDNLGRVSDVQDIVYDPDTSPKKQIYNLQSLSYVDFGAYFVDFIRFDPKWLLSVGSRFISTTGDLYAQSKNRSEKLKRFTVISSQSGLVYTPKDNISLYLNYSEGMNPNYVIDDNSTRFNSPELSYQFEFGMKHLGIDGRMQSTMAIYRIEKKNRVTTSFIDGRRIANNDSAIGVSGFDLDVTYQAQNNLNIIGSFSILDAKNTAGQYKGLEPPSVSDITSSFFIQYSLGDDLLNGLSINAGAYFVGDRYVDNENSDVLNGFGVIDLGSAYRFKANQIKCRIQLSIKNLFDHRYISSTERGLRDTSGARRSFILSTQLDL